MRGIWGYVIHARNAYVMRVRDRALSEIWVYGLCSQRYGYGTIKENCRGQHKYLSLVATNHSIAD